MSPIPLLDLGPLAQKDCPGSIKHVLRDDDIGNSLYFMITRSHAKHPETIQSDRGNHPRMDDQDELNSWWASSHRHLYKALRHPRSSNIINKHSSPLSADSNTFFNSYSCAVHHYTFLLYFHRYLCYFLYTLSSTQPHILSQQFFPHKPSQKCLSDPSSPPRLSSH